MCTQNTSNESSFMTQSHALIFYFLHWENSLTNLQLTECRLESSILSEASLLIGAFPWKMTESTLLSLTHRLSRSAALVPRDAIKIDGELRVFEPRAASPVWAFLWQQRSIQRPSSLAHCSPPRPFLSFLSLCLESLPYAQWDWLHFLVSLWSMHAIWSITDLSRSPRTRIGKKFRHGLNFRFRSYNPIWNFISLEGNKIKMNKGIYCKGYEDVSVKIAKMCMHASQRRHCMYVLCTYHRIPTHGGF